MFYRLGDLDHFNGMAIGATARFLDLPAPLRWIEPSINGPFLDACRSYVYGSYFACLATSAVLLEHTLRIAVLDVAHEGKVSARKWNHLSNLSIREFIEGTKCDDSEVRAIDRLIPAEEEQWWIEVASSMVRNKVSHLDVPNLITKLGNYEPYVGEYVDQTEATQLKRSRSWWGSFFHKTDALVARGFLGDSRERIASLADRARWSGGGGEWAAQEGEYDEFFQYKWDFKNMVASLRRIGRSPDQRRRKSVLRKKR